MTQRPSIDAGDPFFSNTGPSQAPEDHIERMKEFMNRPATPPPFPDDLPSRPSKKPINKWMLISFMLLAALLGTVTPLAVLLGLAQYKARAPQSLPPVAAQAHATTEVATMMHTTTFTLNTTVTSVETFTFPSISYITATITAPAQSTGIVSDPETCKNNNEPIILGRNFCVMVKTCNEDAMDVKENDCKGFCEVAKCTGNKGTLLTGLPAQLRGCCEHCACFL